jgi:hypothetical protein
MSGAKNNKAYSGTGNTPRHIWGISEEPGMVSYDEIEVLDKTDTHQKVWLKKMPWIKKELCSISTRQAFTVLKWFFVCFLSKNKFFSGFGKLAHKNRCKGTILLHKCAMTYYNIVSFSYFCLPSPEKNSLGSETIFLL